MSIDKEEQKIRVKAKLIHFVRQHNINLFHFLQTAGIARMTWHRLMQGKDPAFSTIIKIVEHTRGFISFEDCAKLLENPPVITPIGVTEKKKSLSSRVLKHVDDEDFGRDPMLNL